MKEETETPADRLIATAKLCSGGAMGSDEEMERSAYFANGDSFRRAGRIPRGSWLVTEQQSECGESW